MVKPTDETMTLGFVATPQDDGVRMSCKTFLLVGGPRDGVRVQLHNPPPAMLTMPYTDGKEVHHAVYDREFFKGSDKHFTIYRFTTLSVGELVQHLIDHYPCYPH